MADNTKFCRIKNTFFQSKKKFVDFEKYIVGLNA